MRKRLVSALLLPIILTGCQATFTNLTPRQQVRNPNNLYPVEVALDSRQQSMRWESIRPQIVVGNEAYPMRPTPLMTNRWEGLVPIPANKNWIYYQYRFDYNYNALGKPKSGTLTSPEYAVRIQDK
jgi:hypothetical protein